MKTIVVLSFLSLLFSCQNAPLNFEGGDPRDEMVELEAAYLMAPAKIIASADTVVSNRKLIRTGSLTMSVEKVTRTRTEIEKLCKSNNAYISSETQANHRERYEYHQVIRIPAARFDELVGKIEGLAAEVEHKNIENADVTEEFIDKEARIKTKKELENRYREILKLAKDVSDILSIEAQLNNVRADIESMEGRLNYLRNQVSYSTLTLTFYEPIGAEFGFGSKTVSAFSNGWDMLLQFLIGVVNIWPFIILVAVAYYLIRRRLPGRKWSSNPQA